MLVINGQESNYHLGNSQDAVKRNNGYMAAKHGTWPNRIKDFATQRGLSQADLARLTGYDPPVVARFWHGQRKLHQQHLKIFAEAFGCLPEEIISSSQAKQPDELNYKDVAMLYALKSVIRALEAPAGKDKAKMLREDLKHALNHYRTENKPGAVVVMEELLAFVGGPQHQEARSTIHKLLQLSPGSQD